LKIIAIGHKARQGKDTLANSLRVSLIKKGYTVKKIGFADALYEECRRMTISIDEKAENKFIFNLYGVSIVVPMDNLEDDFLDWWDKVRGRNSIYQGMRDKDPFILQWWGTDFRRKQNVHYWTGRLWEYCKNVQPKPDFILISDCRFRNEADFVKEQGGEVWRIRRVVYNEEGTFQLVNLDRDHLHQSEIDLDNFEFDITINADSVVMLEQQGEQILQELLQDGITESPPTSP